jgi:hypothetical protein
MEHAQLQALRDYDDYLSYYGLKEQCADVGHWDAVDQYYGHCCSGSEPVSEPETPQVEESDSSSEELGVLSEERETESVPPLSTTDSQVAEEEVIVFAAQPELARETELASEEQPEDSDDADPLLVLAASMSRKHARAESIGSSWTVDSVELQSRASSWAEVSTPRCPPRDDEMDGDWAIVAEDAVG